MDATRAELGAHASSLAEACSSPSAARGKLPIHTADYRLRLDRRTQQNHHLKKSLKKNTLSELWGILEIKPLRNTLTLI